MKYFNNIYIILLTGFLFNSCINESFMDKPCYDSYIVEFDVQTVKTGIATRALTSIDENYIQNMSVLVFDLENNFLYSKKAISFLNNNTDGSLKKVKFNFDESDITTNVKLVFLANIQDMDSLLEAISSGMSLNQIQSLFLFDFTSKWHVQSSDDFMPVPMWGMINQVSFVSSEGDAGVSVRLIRALARINITMGGGEGLHGIELSSIDVFNYRTAGYIWPQTANFDFLNNVAIKPSITDLTPVSSGSLSYPVLLPGRIQNEIYITETDNSNSDRLCLIVGVSIGGNETEYFRIDFIDETNSYLSVLRNHSYNFDIIGFSGIRGYATKIEALNSPGENINYILTTIDNSSHNITVTDEQYKLSLDKDEFMIPLAGSNEDWLIFTDVPSGWSINMNSFEINGIPVLEKPNDINLYQLNSTREVYAGNADLNYYLTLSVGANTSREISFVINAGSRIFKKVIIKQQ